MGIFFICINHYLQLPAKSESNNMIPEIAILAVIAATGHANLLVNPAGQDQIFEGSVIEFMLDAAMKGQTLHQLMDSNDGNGDGCMTEEEMVGWMESHSLLDPNQVPSRLTGEAFETDPLFLLATRKIVTDFILQGTNMGVNEFFMEVSGGTDCFTFDTLRKWAMSEK